MSDSATPPSEPVTIRRNDGENRYELTVDGEFAGFTAYLDNDEQRVFYHTEVGEAYGGRGLSTALVAEALADVRRSGKHAVAVCPFVAAYVRKHPEFHDIADPATPDVLRLLKATSDGST